jgi:chromosome partitioning protein
VRQRLNPGLRITGLVFCMYDGRATLSSEVIADVEEFFSRASTAENPLLGDARVLRTRVRRNIKLAEAPGFGQTIFEYAPASHGAEDYEQLAGELLEKQSSDLRPQTSGSATADTATPSPDPLPSGESGETATKAEATTTASPGTAGGFNGQDSGDGK